jgi:hypothetical protein
MFLTEPLEPQSGAATEFSELLRRSAAQKCVLAAQIEVGEAAWKILRVEQDRKSAEEDWIDPVLANAGRPVEPLASEVKSQPHDAGGPVEFIADFSYG